MKYNSPYGIPDPEAPYINGDPSIGRPGSIPPAAAMEYPQREIVNVIVNAGIAPSNDDLFQLWEALQRIRSSRYAVDESSTPNIITITLTPPLNAYFPGLSLLVKVANNNSDGTTINANGLGPVAVTHRNGDALVPSDVVHNGIAFLVFDGVAFQLINPLSAGSNESETSLIHFGHDSGLANVLSVADLAPSITAYAPGLTVLIEVGHANTLTSATINISGLGIKNITRGSGGALTAGDLITGIVAVLVYDGTQFQLINPQAFVPFVPASGDQIPSDWDSIAGPLRPYWIAVNSATVGTPPGSPALGDTYLIPVGATGAWAALVNQLAEWAGATRGWRYRDYPKQSVVGVADTDKFLKRTATGWIELLIPTAAYLRRRLFKSSNQD